MGYGTIGATNTAERIYVCCGMVIGAAIFTYVIGTICTLVSGLNVTSIEFQGRMDVLSEYAAARKLRAKEASLWTAFRCCWSCRSSSRAGWICGRSAAATRL